MPQARTLKNWKEIMTRLITDGDDFEKFYWNKFIKTLFPSYERFWVKFIVPMTNRPANIHLKPIEDLAKDGKSDREIQYAQLHYTALRHLAYVYDLLANKEKFSFDILFEGFLRICSAQDVGFVLIQRIIEPTKYEPWQGRSIGGDLIEAWKGENIFPEYIRNIRWYRNYLAHSQLMPTMIIDKILYVPMIGKEKNYYDWRKIDSAEKALEVKNDFTNAHDLLNNAWVYTVKHLNDCWQNYLGSHLSGPFENDPENVEAPSQIIVASGQNYLLNVGTSGVVVGDQKIEVSGWYVGTNPSPMTHDTNAATFISP
jgi:hypothetical protein